MFQVIGMGDQGTFIAHHLDMLLAVVLNLDVWVDVAVDVDGGHLALQLLDVVEVLLGYVMSHSIERALELVVEGLQKQVEAIEAKLIATREDEHLPVYLVV